MHVADVTRIKQLEAKLLDTRREMLRSVIETQEKERADIAEALRDSVNQTLVYCKLMLDGKISDRLDMPVQEKLKTYIHQAINELNTLSISLIPSDLTLIGLIGGTQNYIDNFIPARPFDIDFEFEEDGIEELQLSDKLSIFRIIQDFLILITESLKATRIKIRLLYANRCLQLQLTHDDADYSFQMNSKESRDIGHRVEYYGGDLEETKSGRGKTLSIRLCLNDAR